MRVAFSTELATAFGRHARRFLARGKSAGLVLLFAACAGTFAYTAWRLIDARRANAAIAALEQREDVAVDPKRAHGHLLMARLRLLTDQGRMEEAQVLVDGSRDTPPALRAHLLYNLANARVRGAITLIEKGELDKAIPIVRLAKEAYRESLRLDPSYWDSKHNYDVAMRLVRDLPGVEQESEDVPPDAPKRLWTDLPGVPKGLP